MSKHKEVTAQESKYQEQLNSEVIYTVGESSIDYRKDCIILTSPTITLQCQQNH